MSDYNLKPRCGGSGGTVLISSSTYHCDKSEEYLTTPLVNGSISYQMSGGDTRASVTSSINRSGSGRYGCYIRSVGGNFELIDTYNGSGVTFTFVSTGDALVSPTSQYPTASFNENNAVSVSGILSTNIPIFTSLADLQNYERRGGDYIENAINYKEGVDYDETTVEYYIYNRYRNASIERGIISFNEDVIHQLNERILYNGSKICLYRDASNKFLLTLKCDSDIVGSYFSNTGDIGDVPYDQFSSQLDYSSPFYSTYDVSLGVNTYSGNIAIGLATNIPIWGSEAEADDYLDGVLDITDSENWDKISSDNAFKNIIDNLTEQPEQTTEFGEVFVRNIFSQLYLCNTAALYEISNNLFDYDVTTMSGVWEDIKKGLEMYGSNPMECVQGLRFYPFDLTTIFTQTQSQNYIYFGAYQLSLQNSSVYKMIYANGYKDLGSVTIKRTFKDWRDFEPYTKLSIYLPYVGRYQLDLKKYYDKTVNIRYYLDIRTGACCACLIANGILLDWFDGLIGTEMPITLTDYSSYAQNQINIIMRNAGIGVAGEGAVGALGVKGVNAAMNYSAGEQGAAFANTYAAQGGGNAAFSAAQSASAAAGKAGAVGVAGSMGLMAAGMGVVALGVAEKTAFDMMRTGTAAYTKGRPGSSAMINQFLPQYPTFMFEIQEIDESPYLNELYGRPSNASGRLGDFSGYLEAEDVMLICPIATDNERQEIIDLVKSGIYL